MNEDNTENLRLLYRELMGDKLYFSNKLWETLKFTTTIYTAILSITALLITQMVNNSNNNNIYSVLIISSISLLISAIAISYIGWFNIRRENARFYETVASLKKVEKSLGFFEILGESERVFKKDKYLLPNDFFDFPSNDKVKEENTEYFINWMFKRQKKDYIGFIKRHANRFIDWCFSDRQKRLISAIKNSRNDFIWYFFRRKKKINYGKFYSTFTRLFQIYAFIALVLIIVIIQLFCVFKN